MSVGTIPDRQSGHMSVDRARRDVRIVHAEPFKNFVFGKRLTQRRHTFAQELSHWPVILHDRTITTRSAGSRGVQSLAHVALDLQRPHTDYVEPPLMSGDEDSNAQAKIHSPGVDIRR